MSDSNKTCPIPGCAAPKREGDLMCWHHWSRVTLTTQQEVCSTWLDLCLAPTCLGYVLAYRRAAADAKREAMAGDGIHRGSGGGE